MGDIARDSQNYYTFLQNSLAQSATEQSLGETIQSEVQQVAIGSTESQEMGTEILVSTLPAFVPTVIDTYQKVQKIYQNVKDIGSQVGKITDALKTLPNDVKKLYGTKVNQIEALVRDGGSENLAKAKSLYLDLQNTAQKAAQTGKSLATNTANQMVDLTKDTIAKGKDMASGLLEQGKSIANDATNKFSDITGKSQDIIDKVTVNSADDLKTLRENFLNMKDNFRNLAQEQSNKIDAHIQNIKDTVPLEQQEALIKEAEDSRTAFTNQLKDKYQELKQNTLSKGDSNPEIVGQFKQQLNNIPKPELAPEPEPVPEPAPIQMTPLETIQSKLPTNLLEGENIPMAKSAPQDLIDRYTNARSRADELSRSLQREADPDVRASLTTELQNARTELRTSSRLVELNTPATESVIARVKTAVPKMPTIEINPEEMRGPMTDELYNRIMGRISDMPKPDIESLVNKNVISQTEQISTQAEQALNNTKALATQHVEQINNTVKETASQANELASKTTTQASQLLNETASQAKSNLTEGVEQSKSLLTNTTNDLTQTAKNATDLVAENATKLSSAAESISKMGISDLAEVSGLSAIPVVGEIAGIAALGFGVVSGIKDLFTHSSAPAIQQAPTVAGIVHQAGL